MSRSRSTRNKDKYTSSTDAKKNVLRHLLECGDGSALSRIGYAAFPGYRFKAPQGAALSAARITKELERDGFLRRDFSCGYVLTEKGRKVVREGGEL